MKGDPHWDNTTQWEAFGEKHTGGIWLKKLSVIANENNKQLADLKLKNHENIDMRATYKTYNSLLISGKPKDSEINNYFFLPALGHYVIGQLGDLGSLGFYWSSSAHPSDSSYAYYLNFGSSSVYVYNGYRNYGLVAQPFE